MGNEVWQSIRKAEKYLSLLHSSLCTVFQDRGIENALRLLLNEINALLPTSRIVLWSVACNESVLTEHLPSGTLTTLADTKSRTNAPREQRRIAFQSARDMLSHFTINAGRPTAVLSRARSQPPFDVPGFMQHILHSSEQVNHTLFDQSVLSCALSKTHSTLLVLSFMCSRNTEYGEAHKSIAEDLTLLVNSVSASFNTNRADSITLAEPAKHGKEARDLLGLCKGLSGVIRQIEAVAPSDCNVLILGETGVGKEMIANAVHDLSLRRDGAFVKINCGAITETLIDSELFGHEKGAFTGAVHTRAGYFEQANGGTILLDEIGEMPLHAQLRLLRVLDHKEIQRVGGTSMIPVNVRLLAASNRDLQHMVNVGTFREDLLFRLRIFPIEVPPLRSRREDILPLANYFLQEKAHVMGLEQVPCLSAKDEVKLSLYPWPGNVRQLLAVIERALIQSRILGRLSFEDLDPPARFEHNGILWREGTGITPPSAARPPEFGSAVSRSPQSAEGSLAQLMEQHIRAALAQTGKISGKGGAAELLGVHPNTLRARMQKLGIPFIRDMKWQAR